MNFLSLISISLLGGVLPALFWLWFWLKEDRLHPEPRSRLILVFLAGMASVFLVLPLEQLALNLTGASMTTLTILLWAAIEEICKYGVAYWTALRCKDTDEPIDAIIYMITVALGFSALENSLFLSNLIDLRLFSDSIVTGNSRFLGATLLHIVSSSAIGVLLGLAYYKKAFMKKVFLFTGLLLSIMLHTIFNLLIIRSDNSIFLVFTGVWTLVIMLIVLIEKVKTIQS